MISELGFDGKRLEAMTAEGFFECRRITYDSIDQYQVWFHKTQDGGLWVNWALQLNDCPIFETLSIALDLIAKEFGCNYITFTTRRPALVAKAECYGYEGQSLMMVKRFNRPAIYG